MLLLYDTSPNKETNIKHVTLLLNVTSLQDGIASMYTCNVYTYYKILSM